MPILPGAVGPLTSLQDAMRDRYERIAAGRLEHIADRSKRGIPLDDATKWPAVVDFADKAKAAAQQQDPAALREAALGLLESASPPVEPLAPYEPTPAFDGIRFRVRKLSKREHAIHGEVNEIATQSEGLPASAYTERLLRDADSLDAQGRYVARAVAYVEIDGAAYEGERLPQEAIDALTYSDALTQVYVAARDAQSLGPFAARLFGSSPQSTSESTTATDVHGACGGSLVVMAEPAPGTSREPSTRPIGASDATGSTIPASLISSSSTGAPMEGSTSQG